MKKKKKKLFQTKLYTVIEIHNITYEESVNCEMLVSKTIYKFIIIIFKYLRVCARVCVFEVT